MTGKLKLNLKELADSVRIKLPEIERRVFGSDATYAEKLSLASALISAAKYYEALDRLSKE